MDALARVALNLDGSVDDWRKITKMKAWWIARIWHTFGHLAGAFNRLLWIDADARLNGPLDIELGSAAEVIAGAWWRDARHPGYDTIASGLLLFQGSSQRTIGLRTNPRSEADDGREGHGGHLPAAPQVSQPWSAFSQRGGLDAHHAPQRDRTPLRDLVNRDKQVAMARAASCRAVWVW